MVFVAALAVNALHRRIFLPFLFQIAAQVFADLRGRLNAEIPEDAFNLLPRRFDWFMLHSHLSLTVI